MKLEIFESCLLQLKEEYLQQEQTFLTEADVVCTLFCKIKSLLSTPQFSVHSQSVPFLQEDENVLVIKGGKEWTTSDRGSAFDLVIIDNNEKYWKEALQLAERKTKAGRIVWYPAKAFLLACEVKVRVNGNFDGIKKDITKLATLKEYNPNCHVHLVLMDRTASQSALKKAQSLAESYEVQCVTTMEFTNE